MNPFPRYAQVAPIQGHDTFFSPPFERIEFARFLWFHDFLQMLDPASITRDVSQALVFFEFRGRLRVLCLHFGLVCVNLYIDTADTLLRRKL